MQAEVPIETQAKAKRVGRVGRAPLPMGFENRCRYDILAAIMRVAEKPMLKTHIMFEIALSVQGLNLYLDYSMRRGLISEALVPMNSGRNRRMYQTTLKGRIFLTFYDKMIKRLGEPEEEKR